MHFSMILLKVDKIERDIIDRKKNAKKTKFVYILTPVERQKANLEIILLLFNENFSSDDQSYQICHNQNIYQSHHNQKWI